MVFDAVIVFLSLGVDIGIVVVNIRARSFTDNAKTKSSIHISLIPSKKSIRLYCSLWSSVWDVEEAAVGTSTLLPVTASDDVVVISVDGKSTPAETKIS